MIKSRCGGYKKDIKPQALPGIAPGRLSIKGGVNEEKNMLVILFIILLPVFIILEAAKKS